MDEEVLDYEVDPEPATATEANGDSAAEAAEPAEPAKEDQPAAAAKGGGAVAAANGDGGGKDGGDDPMSLPSHWCEVFVGGVPKSATDDEVRDFCSEAGEVFSCNLLKDPAHPDQNRGYGFVKYRTKVAAASAMETLSGGELPGYPGTQLRLHPSQSKYKLYLGNIPRDMAREQLEAAVRDVTVGLERVELLMERSAPGQNRGFCFLEYRNHAAAQKAKTTLSDSSTFRLGPRSCIVSFADKPEDPSARLSIKGVYIGNLTEQATEAKLRGAFAKFGEVQRIVIPPDNKGGKQWGEFGFVHYSDHASAVRAWEACEAEPIEMDGKILNVRMARASSTQQRDQQQQQQQGGRRGGRGGQQSGDYEEGGYGGSGYDDWGGAVGEADASGGYGAAAGYGMAAGGYGMMAAGMMGGAGGMAMVPMMLPNGQVGYVLAGGTGAGSAASAGYGVGAAGAVTTAARTGAGGAGGPLRRGSSAAATGGSMGGGYGASAGYGSVAGYGAGYGAGSGGGGYDDDSSAGYGAGMGGGYSGYGGGYGTGYGTGAGVGGGYGNAGASSGGARGGRAGRGGRGAGGAGQRYRPY